MIRWLRVNKKSLFLDLKWSQADDPQARLVSQSVAASCGIEGLMVGWSADPVFVEAAQTACPGVPVGWMPSSKAFPPSLSTLTAQKGGGLDLVLVWHTWTGNQVDQVLSDASSAGVRPVWCCAEPPSRAQITKQGGSMILDHITKQGS